MRIAEPPPRCRAARAWLSAYRDAEVLDDGRWRDHIDSCAGCALWESMVDDLTRRARVRPADSPDVIMLGLAEWQGHAANEKT